MALNQNTVALIRSISDMMGLQEPLQDTNENLTIFFSAIELEDPHTYHFFFELTRCYNLYSDKQSVRIEESVFGFKVIGSLNFFESSLDLMDMKFNPRYDN